MKKLKSFLCDPLRPPRLCVEKDIDIVISRFFSAKICDLCGLNFKVKWIAKR